MEKITDKIAAIPNDGTYFSLEFFPPKTQMVRSSLGCVKPLLTTSQGVLQFTRSPGAYVTGSSASLCYRNMGRRRLHFVQVSGTCRNMPETYWAYNLFTPDMHKYAARGHR